MSSYQQGVPIEINDSFTVDGTPTNPTLLVYSILGPDLTITTYTFPGAAEITNPSLGSFTLSLDPPALPGTYQYDVDATGAVTASRSGSFEVLASWAVPESVPWAIPGPCSAWCDSQDVWDCCGQPMTTLGAGSSATECPVDMTAYAIEASQLLFELSGRVFAGACAEKTVRPCSSRGCGFQVLDNGHVIGPWDLTGGGWDWGWGVTGWLYGDDSACGCIPADRIHLSGLPVREITEVKIDGAVIPEANNWRLDERQWLTRIADVDGNAQWWPSCQRMDLPDTAAGTFSVSYRYGMDPPLIGVHAAEQLACQLYKACSGDASCALPAGTVRVTRQGVTMERQFFARDKNAGAWVTGLNLVDLFLNSYNRQGRTRRPAMWAPGRRSRYARPVG